ncbi:hypothetical protein L6Q96_07935 [Candidatus Binatia bacterium]|nr:hypothetical protein [Candidatus Binatia bacterium]
MGTVIDISGRRRARPSRSEPPTAVRCAKCNESHPVIRLADGSSRCVTAFNDGERWFCRNRGCRAAWLVEHGKDA